MIQNYEYQKELRDYEFDTATRAYETSVAQAAQQKQFNQIAERVALQEQDQKRADDLLKVMFDQRQTFLDYQSNSAGVKFDKFNQLVDADFRETKSRFDFAYGSSKYELERNEARSKAQIDTQKAIVDGMKAAGRLSASGTAGRSAAKGVLGVMAESGAARAAIANNLMYAEQGVELGLAQLKDLLVMEQTMVAASRDKAVNEADLKQTKLDADKGLDFSAFAETRRSIKQRDALVRQKLLNQRMEADMRAEAKILLRPEAMPELQDPRVLYEKYDKEDTDYVEMLLRPRFTEFPEFNFPDHLPRSAFKGERENVAMSNFGDVLKIGGMVAGAVGGLGAATAVAPMSGGTAVSGFMGGMTAQTANVLSTVGTGLTGLGNSFYTYR